MTRSVLWEQSDRDLYATLGVDVQASESQIQSAWRTAVREHHPDVGGAAQDFTDVHIAYLVLSDPKQRVEYDRYRLANAATQSPPIPPAPEPEPETQPATYERPRTLWLLAAIALIAVVGSYIWPGFTVVTGIVVGIVVMNRYHRMGFGLIQRR